MLEDAEEILTKMLIKEHFESKDKKFIITKEDLIRFVLKYNKVLLKVQNEVET